MSAVDLAMHTIKYYTVHQTKIKCIECIYDCVCGSKRERERERKRERELYVEHRQLDASSAMVMFETVEKGTQPGRQRTGEQAPTRGLFSHNIHPVQIYIPPRMIQWRAAP